MKFFTISSALMLKLALTLATSSVVHAQSPNSSHQEKGCSNRTLLGDYGAKIEGTLLGPNWAVRTLVLFRFDGHGNVTSFGHPVVNGTPPAEEWAETAGIYTVNPDCTGSATIEGAPPIPLHLVVVNRGRQVYVVVDANATIGEARKVG